MLHPGHTQSTSLPVAPARIKQFLRSLFCTLGLHFKKQDRWVFLCQFSVKKKNRQSQHCSIQQLSSFIEMIFAMLKEVPSLLTQTRSVEHSYFEFVLLKWVPFKILSALLSRSADLCITAFQWINFEGAFLANVPDIIMQ